jgi:autotransporter translocation and assembly factor TamB
MHKKLKIILFALGGGLVLITLLTTLTVGLANTDLARRALLKRINATLTGALLIEDHRLALLSGQLELRQIQLRNAQGEALVSLERLLVDWRWRDLLDRTLYFEQILLDTPRGDLRIDADGRLNILELFPKSTAAETPDEDPDRGDLPVNIVVAELRVGEGGVRFQHQPSETRIRLTGLETTAAGDLRARQARLDLALAGVELDTPKIDTRLSPVKLQAALRGDTLTLDALELSTAQTRLRARGNVQDLSSKQRLDLSVDMDGELAEWASLLPPDHPLSGHLAAGLTVKGLLNDPAATLKAIYDGGRLAGIPVTAGRLELTLAERKLALKPLRLQPSEGELQVQGRVDLSGVWPTGFLSATPQLQELTYHLEVKAEALPLNLLPQMPAGYAGRLGGDVVIRGQGIAPHQAGSEDASFSELEADLTLTDGQTPLAGTPLEGTPTALTLSTRSRLTGGVFTLADLNLDAPQATLSTHGRMDLSTDAISAETRIQAADLSRLTALTGLDHLAGRIQGDLVLDGSLARPQARFDFSGADLAAQKITLGAMEIKGDIQAGKAHLKTLTLHNGASHLNLSGEAELYDADSLTPLEDPRFSFDLDAPVLEIGDYVPQAKGRLAVAGKLQGSPSAPSAHLRIDGRELLAGGQAFSTLAAELNFADQRLNIRNFQLALADDATISAAGWVDTAGSYQLTLGSRGLPLAAIAGIDAQKAVSGNLSFDFRGAGQLNDPQLNGDIHLRQMQLNDKPIDDGHLRVAVKAGQVRVSGGLNFDLSGTYVWVSQAFEVDARFHETELGPYLVAAGQADLDGQLSGHIQARGNLSQPEKISAQVDMTQIDIGYKDHPLLSTEKLEAVFEGRTLRLAPTRLRLLEAGALEAVGQIDLEGPVALKIDGQVPLAVARPFMDDGNDLEGFADLHLTLAGSMKDPDIRASVDLDQVAMTLPVTFQKLKQLKGKIRYDGRRIEIDDLAGKVEAGRFSLNGQADIEGGQLKHADLNFQARALPLAVPDTADIKIDSDLRLTGNREAARLDGEVMLLEGLYYKDVKLGLLKAATTRRRAQAPRVAAEPNAQLQAIAVEIRVGHRQPFFVDNNLATIQVVPDLQVGGTLAQPVLSGRATVTEGELTYQKKTFTVTRGVVDFINPYRIDPEVDVVGETQVRDWKITLAVVGTPEALIFKLSSDPEEEDSDILSLLLLGRTSRELIEGEGGSTQSTRQMLAGLVASTMGDDIKRVAGVDIFEVDTQNDEEDPESERVQVTLGKKLSRRMTVKYALESKQGAFTRRVVSEYKFFDRLLMTGFQDSAGVFGGELVFRLEFR